MPQQQDPPLSQARQEFTDAIWQEATACPCCGRFAMVAHWSIGLGQKAFLLEIARRGGRQMAWVKAQDVYHHLRNGEGAAGASAYSPLKHFGVVEKLDDFDPAAKQEQRDLGASGTGLWRVTPLGWRFILGRAAVPKTVWVFDDRVLKTSHETVRWSDLESPAGFDWNEMMRGAMSVAPEEFAENTDQMQLL